MARSTRSSSAWSRDSLCLRGLRTAAPRNPALPELPIWLLPLLRPRLLGGDGAAPAVGASRVARTRNSAATQPSLPSGSRTEVQTRPSASCRSPRWIISVPSGQTLIRSAVAPGARRTETPWPPLPSIISGKGPGVTTAAGKRGGVGAGVGVASCGGMMTTPVATTTIGVGGAVDAGLGAGEAQAIRLMPSRNRATRNRAAPYERAS